MRLLLYTLWKLPKRKLLRLVLYSLFLFSAFRFAFPDGFRFLPHGAQRTMSGKLWHCSYTVLPFCHFVAQIDDFAIQNKRAVPYRVK